MKRNVFECIEIFGDYVANQYYSYKCDKEFIEFDGITVIAEYGYICDLANYLISEYDFNLYESKLYDDEFEYLLTLDYDGMISIERVLSDNGKYLYFDADLLLIHEYCNSKILSVNNHIYTEEFAFEWDNYEYDNNLDIYECDGDCEHCELNDDENDDYSPIIQVSLRDLFEIFEEYKNNL